MSENQSNGRVNIMSPNTEVLFAMQDKAPVKSLDFRQSMTGNWSNTPLSNAYFSAQNMQIIQNGIRAGVYNKSRGQYQIGEQDPDELNIIMRSVFLQFSKNLPTDIAGQITVLNARVLNYSIPQVYGEAEGYMKYVYDASNMYDPIAPPVMTTVNDKQLEGRKWF
jgi:hypothetical protein